MHAWQRRKQVEARWQAVEIVKALGEALGNGEGSQENGNWVEPEALLETMGVRL